MRSAELGQRTFVKHDNLRDRTKTFALRVIRLVESLPKSGTAKVIGHQLVRSSTSVGANYRAACRARSTADFIAKMGIVEEECDECVYWMELLVESDLVEEHLLQDLMNEANELVAIAVTSIKTTRKSKGT